MSLVNSRTLSTRPRPRTIEIHVLEDSITGAQTCHFRNLAFPGLKERFCPWERTFPGRKHSFVHGNANSPTNDQSEFGQDNGRTRNTAAKVEVAHRLLWGRPRVFTIPTALNLHFSTRADNMHSYLSRVDIFAMVHVNMERFELGNNLNTVNERTAIRTYITSFTFEIHSGNF